jgi:hypothetical protein
MWFSPDDVIDSQVWDLGPLVQIAGRNELMGNQTYGELALQYVPSAIQHLDVTFEYFRKCGGKWYVLADTCIPDHSWFASPV